MTVSAGFATDQYGVRWIVMERAGALWALGMDDDAPVIRSVGVYGSIIVDLHRPRAIRTLNNLSVT